VSIGSDHEPAEREPDDGRFGGTVDLARLTWLITTCTLLVGMTVLAFKREWGYAGVTCAVAISAGINLL
jgi:hypothetical protein